MYGNCKILLSTHSGLRTYRIQIQCVSSFAQAALAGPHDAERAELLAEPASAARLPGAAPAQTSQRHPKCVGSHFHILYWTVGVLVH